MTVKGTFTITNSSRFSTDHDVTVMGNLTTVSGTTIYYGASDGLTSVYGNFDMYGQVSFLAATGIRQVELYGASKNFRLSSSGSAGGYANYHIRSGASYTASSTFSQIGSAPEFVVDGTFQISSSSSYLSGGNSSTFKVNSGGTLKVENSSGLSTWADGAIRTTNRIFDAGANYYFIGYNAQVTGDALPVTLTGSLVFANSYGTTLTNSISTSGSVTVTGILKTSGQTISGAGSFTLNSGASLYTDSPDGISASGATGSIQTTTRTFNGGAYYYYYAGVAQVTGNGLPALIYYGSLAILNTAGVTLSRSTEIRNLNLQGRLLMGGYDLTLSPGFSLTGSPGSVANMIVQDGTGRLIVRFDEVAQPQVPIGDYSGGTYRYSLFSMYVNASAFSNARVTLDIQRGKHAANTSMNNYLTRSWSFTATGFTSPSVNLYIQYDQNDVTGDESQIFGAKYDGTVWNIMGQVNATNNTFEQSSMNGFYTVTGGEESALPVELVSFTARRLGGDVVLHWQTATEVDNAGFAVERKNPGGWENLGFVEGNGTSNSPKYYDFRDNSVGTAGITYRLKQIDNSGSITYSGEVSVEGIPVEFELSQNHPNPFNPSTDIHYSIPVEGEVKLHIYNALGQKITTLVNEVKQPGEHSVSFDGSSLSSGVYIYELRAGELSIRKKMILVE